MARPGQEAVEAFMRLTGASESLAIRKLEEYRGNIRAAVNAYLSEIYNYRSYYAPAFSQHNYANMNGESQGGQHGLLSLFNTARSFRLASLLDPNYRSHLLNQFRGSSSVGAPVSVSQSGGTGPVPIEFNSLPSMPPHLARQPTFEHDNHTSSSSKWDRGSDSEDKMIKAAIEASKQHASDLEVLQRYRQQEDDDLAHAVSLSLRMAEEEKAIRELENKDGELAADMEHKGGASFHHRLEKDTFSSKEWGAITSKEFNESVLLEAALFGGVSERSLDDSLPVSYRQDHQIQGSSRGRNLQPVPCFSLPSSSTQQPQKQQEEKGGILFAQEASFPRESEINDKDRVSLLIRMPDGRRHECHFLQSDKLQLLFNFINEKMDMKPGTYKVVRPYPRCAFGVEEGSMTLRELGLTGKQEALFMELI